MLVAMYGNFIKQLPLEFIHKMQTRGSAVQHMPSQIGLYRLFNINYD